MRVRPNQFIKFSLVVGMILGAIIGILAGAYFVHGSLETHPTEEAHSKVRLITGSAVVLVCVLELVLWSVVRRLR